MCKYCPIVWDTDKLLRGLSDATATIRAFGNSLPKSKKKRRGKKWKGVK